MKVHQAIPSAKNLISKQYEAHSMKQDFCIQMEALLGQDEANMLTQAIEQSTPPVSVRVNALKPSDTLPAPADGAVPWCAAGQYLAERPRFTYDPLLHAGCYYVQEAASMFVEQAYKQITTDFTPHRLLDLCAAPGGKSTLWRSLMCDGDLLVANEPIRQRAQILAENLTKWGHPDVVCTSAYPEEFAPLGSFFDVIAADVPCSGEGMFRKDAVAIDEWSPQAVDSCAARQWQIIESVWPALRQGGYLVYSTCTYNRQEDEDNVVRICNELGAELVPIATQPEWGIAGDTTGRNLPVYHFFPHKTKGEGLFLALLRKTSEAPVAKEKKGKKQRGNNNQPGIQGGAEIIKWIANSHEFKLLRTDEAHVIAVRQSLADDVQRVCSSVRALTAGIMLVEEKGRKRIPQHALALSVQRAKEAFPVTELSLDDALNYLRREGITLPPDVPRGYVVASYKGHALGFLNNLGARANNLYPQEWRIRN